MANGTTEGRGGTKDQQWDKVDIVSWACICVKDQVEFEYQI